MNARAAQNARSVERRPLRSARFQYGATKKARDAGLFE
jgi:hypothetical protein